MTFSRMHPGDADTRQIADPLPPPTKVANKITFSSFQLAAAQPSLKPSHNVMGCPPSARTFFRLHGDRSWKYPMNWPSGDQNGATPSSVPESAWVVNVSSD